MCIKAIENRPLGRDLKEELEGGACREVLRGRGCVFFSFVRSFQLIINNCFLQGKSKESG